MKEKIIVNHDLTTEKNCSWCSWVSFQDKNSIDIIFAPHLTKKKVDHLGFFLNLNKFWDFLIDLTLFRGYVYGVFSKWFLNERNDWNGVLCSKKGKWFSNNFQPLEFLGG
jgi:hypothetical protein